MEPRHVQPPTPRDDHPGTPPRPLGACEACRAVKLKCQPEPRGGACRRCSDSKRECIYRTRPRTRMSRATRMKRDSPSLRSRQQTFSIDFQVPADDAVGPAFDNLLRDHGSYIDSVLPETLLDPMPFPSPPPSSASPTAHPQTRTVQSLCLQPQFNLDSATSLLDAFRHMLPYFPCIALGEEESVASLARDRPFILLAILATVSGSKTLQGHTLYDDEFRKVMALKVVAGGERSLELAQGLLIYCGWFPFHLRPKHKRAHQYLRMLVDMVRDLELDQKPPGLNTGADITLDHVDGIRTYLSCYYLLTASNSFWPKLNSNHADMRSTPWTSTCWTALLDVSPYPQDHVLAQLARHAYITRETAEANRKRHADGDHTRLVMLGLEVQLREWKAQVPAHVSGSREVVLGGSFTEIFIYCAPLLKFPPPETYGETLAPGPDKVRLAVPLLRSYYDEVVKADLSGFSALDWGRLIISVILGMRLSFPIKGFCWDSSRARAELRFDEFLGALCDGVAGGECADDRNKRDRGMDIGTASRLMFDVVRKKYNDGLEGQARSEEAARITCPVLDGSLDEYLRTWGGESVGNIATGDSVNSSLYHTGLGFVPGFWAGELGSGSGPEAEAEDAGPQVYDDLWATMTTSWPESEVDNLGS